MNNHNSGIFYMLLLNGMMIKIGISSKTLQERYKLKLKKVKVLLVIESTLHNVFLLESILKQKYTNNIIAKQENTVDTAFGYTEIFKNLNVDDFIQTTNIIFDDITKF